MTKLIINADDFGYSKGVNLGIIEAFQNGVVSSTTMMANMPGAEHAAELAKKNPGLGVGIHLVLTCGSPVHHAVSSLTNEKGEFHHLKEIEQFLVPEDVEKEFTSQFERFLSFGLEPTHIDSHHHVHGLAEVYPVVEKLAQRYGLPVRKVSADSQHASHRLLKSVQYFNHEFYGNELTNQSLMEAIEKAGLYETAEIMCHPAFIDEPLLAGSSYALQRVRELSILTDESIRRMISDKKMELVTYREVTNLS